MLPKLQLQFDRIEILNKAFFETLDGMNNQRLQFRSHPGTWNRLQVLQHLYISEKLTLSYMQKKIQSFPTAKKLGISASIRSAILILLERAPFKYKMPSNRIAPDDNVNYSELKDEWNHSRTELRKFLEQFNSQTIRFPVLRHPVVGMLNITQTLRFFEEHFKHHLKQLTRIDKQEI